MMAKAKPSKYDIDGGSSASSSFYDELLQQQSALYPGFRRVPSVEFDEQGRCYPLRPFTDPTDWPSSTRPTTFSELRSVFIPYESCTTSLESYDEGLELKAMELSQEALRRLNSDYLAYNVKRFDEQAGLSAQETEHAQESPCTKVEDQKLYPAKSTNNVNPKIVNAENTGTRRRSTKR